MLFFKQGSESALRKSNGTLFHSFAADTEKFVRPRFLFGTWDIQYLYWHSEFCARDDCYNNVII